MDSEQVRRPRKSRSHRLSAPFQSGSLQRAPGDSDYGGGVDFLADGFKAGISRRPGLWAEVGYGLDARHAGIFPQRSYSPQVSPQTAYISHALFVPREFRAAALAR